MVGKLSLKDLIARLDSPGWHLSTEDGDTSENGTLKDVLESSHRRKQESDSPGFIKQVETTVELDMLQIQQLWQHLGLPTV
jgi:hypothetical protein